MMLCRDTWEREISGFVGEIVVGIWGSCSSVSGLFLGILALFSRAMTVTFSLNLNTTGLNLRATHNSKDKAAANTALNRENETKGKEKSDRK